MACKALTARWEQMVKLVVVLTERFAPVLEVLVAAVEEEAAAAATEAEGMVEAATEAEAIQLLRTHVSLIHHLIVFLLEYFLTVSRQLSRRLRLRLLLLLLPPLHRLRLLLRLSPHRFLASGPRRPLASSPHRPLVLVSITLS